jgi:hypothetical protein
MEHTQQLELIDKLLLHLERGTTASADVIRGAEISVYSNGDLLALEKQKGVRRVLNFIGHAAFDEGGPAFGGASHFDASVACSVPGQTAAAHWAGNVDHAVVANAHCFSVAALDAGLVRRAD